MSKLRRGYLNAVEKNTLMCIGAVIALIDGRRTADNKKDFPIWEVWEKKGMITPSMRKNLKMAYTYLNKFRDEMLSELDKREADKLVDRTSQFDFRIIDNYTVTKLDRQLENKYKYAVLERALFDEILVDIAQVKCIGCNKDYKECSLAAAIDDVAIEYKGEKENCPFSCDLDDLTEENIKRVNELRNKINKKNSFSKIELLRKKG